LLLSTSAALAETQSYKQLSGSGWQWVLSIPAADNPLADVTGEKCMLGQRGADWFSRHLWRRQCHARMFDT